MSLSNYFYEPFFSLSEFDRLFDEAFSARTGNSGNQQVTRQSSSSTRSLRPRMDVHEDAEKNVVTATFELPGLRKEDVNIDVHNNQLTVSGETKQDESREENGYAVRERRFGKFSRTLPLPQGVKPEEIKAGLEHGVLTVTFPNTSAETAPKKITVS
ncbi:small heat shock protein [Neolentinus lepideus HHB14362 ss-1]|uniref:Small heat shock protein n=1 Tax=Neolentinus lepideus HHB14362 ss-1 TaxID=1314782 RepID=A0A165RPC9_9AGAM|nr:small heat shock protein [Neolentinus lepideus HHB14362 ss-1]